MDNSAGDRLLDYVDVRISAVSKPKDPRFSVLRNNRAVNGRSVIVAELRDLRKDRIIKTS